jgi:hypothetical protein
MKAIAVFYSGFQWLRIMIIALLGVLTIVASNGGDGPTQPPEEPTLGISGGLKQLQFTWSASSGATHYNLLENPDGSSGFSVIASNITALSYYFEVAVHLTDWINASYIVEACNASGCASSNAVSIDTLVLESIGYLKASNTETDDHFGGAVALSADGNTLAVGAKDEDSAATGINGDQTDNTAFNAGAVYVFSRTGTSWQQQAYLKASNAEEGDNFGQSVALSADGNTLAVGAYFENSAAKGINGNQADNTAAAAGAVYVFSRTGSTWQQQAYVKASNTDATDQFGTTVALSADGNTLAVGASDEESAATGINGDYTDNSTASAGAVYVFIRTGTIWRQHAYVKASNTGLSDFFGSSVALSADGNTLAVGAYGEDSAATGINGDQMDNTASYSGAVYVFSRTETSWQQQAYIKASNTGADDIFGVPVLSADGDTLAVGAPYEASAATGVNGDQTDNTALYAGAVYVFSRTGTNWQQQAYLKASNTEADDHFGYPIALSADGNTLAAGASFEDGGATGINGDQTDNTESNAGAVYVFSRTGTTWQQQAYIKASNAEAREVFGGSVAISADGNTLAVGALGESSAATGINGDQTDNTAPGAGAAYLY